MLPREILMISFRRVEAPCSILVAIGALKACDASSRATKALAAAAWAAFAGRSRFGSLGRIGPLPVHLRRIVGYGEEDSQQLGIADLTRIVADLHGFGVAGRLGADLVIASVATAPAAKPETTLLTPFTCSKTLSIPPEAAAAKHRGVRLGRGGHRGRDGGERQSSFFMPLM